MKTRCELQENRQRGAVLIVALVMLLLLTIIGTASIRDTSLQEKMAGNLRDSTLAFQAAEAGLRFAEQQVKGDYKNLVNESLYPINDEDPEIKSYTGFTTGVHKAPTYTVTRLPHPGQLNLEDLTNPQLAGGGSIAASEAMILDFVLVKIESTGTGMSENSEVILQSVYFVEE